MTYPEKILLDTGGVCYVAKLNFWVSVKAQRIVGHPLLSYTG